MNHARSFEGDKGMAIIAALFRGEDSEEADAGAYLLADALDSIVRIKAALVKD